jgi:hypothetical protein
MAVQQDRHSSRTKQRNSSNDHGEEADCSLSLNKKEMLDCKCYDDDESFSFNKAFGLPKLLLHGDDEPDKEDCQDALAVQQDSHS